MTLSDQQVKLRLVLLVTAFALVGFVLEIGPVGGVFSLVNKHLRIFEALSIELQTFGFLAYLALPASALVGLHPMEEEPTPKEPPPGEASLHPAGKGEAAREQVRVRPEWHQMRMIFIALGGYTLLKGCSLIFLSHFNLNPAERLHLFNFGFFYVALAWLVMWQFLRWYAHRRHWVRLQADWWGWISTGWWPSSSCWCRSSSCSTCSAAPSPRPSPCSCPPCCSISPSPPPPPCSGSRAPSPCAAPSSVCSPAQASFSCSPSSSRCSNKVSPEDK